jgi:uroporphyrinogen decarboxylase
MNSLERITAAVAFKDTDRAPVIAQVFGHAASLSGVALEDYVRDGETLARCQLNALERYGYDAVFSVMDVNVETEAVGSVLRYRNNQYPVIERYALSWKGDWNLSLPDPQRAGRMPEMLKALRILRQKLGNDVLIAGCVLGPFTLATQLLGIETALYTAVDEPSRLEDGMDLAADVIIRFGLAQLQAGAHLPLVFNPSASPAVIPPKFFREFELPRLKKVFRAFAGAGAVANWLHIAGPIKPIMSCYPKASVNMANFDHCVSAEDAGNELPDTCLTGNLRPLAFTKARPEDIETEALNLLTTFRGRGGFILSSGGEIPPESSPENVAAMVRAAR